jgi:RNA recognition motif-containing protein
MDFSSLCSNENVSSSVSSNSSTTSSSDYYSLFGNGNCFSEPKSYQPINNLNFSSALSTASYLPHQNNTTLIHRPVSQSSSLTSITNTSNDILPPITQQNHQSESNMDRKKLFVGNLPTNTTLQELIGLFGKYGTVNERLSVVKEDNYAFIHFYNEKDAQLAYKELNDSFFKNRYIRVQYSVSNAHIKKSRSKLGLI